MSQKRINGLTHESTTHAFLTHELDAGKNASCKLALRLVLLDKRTIIIFFLKLHNIMTITLQLHTIIHLSTVR